MVAINMPKNNANGIHAQRLKAIRKFVDFDYDLRKPLSNYQKSKIKTYFDEIRELTARPFYAYRPRSKKRLATAQQFAQHEKNLKGLTVAFIPTNGEQKPKIKFNKKGELATETKHVKTRFLGFDKNKLIENAKNHTNAIIKKVPDAKTFTILAGKFEIPNSFSRERVGEWVAKFSEKYGNRDAANYFGNWMTGLAAHTFKDQSNFDEYREAKNKNKKMMQTKRRNENKRNKRNKGK